MDKGRVLRFVGVSAAAVGLVATGATGATVASRVSNDSASSYQAMAEQRFTEAEDFKFEQARQRGGKNSKGMRHQQGSGLNSLVQDGTLTQEQVEAIHENMQTEMQAQRLAVIEKVLGELVANSTLTQEQADQVKNILENHQIGRAGNNNSLNSTSA